MCAINWNRAKNFNNAKKCKKCMWIEVKPMVFPQKWNVFDTFRKHWFNAEYTYVYFKTHYYVPPHVAQSFLKYHTLSYGALCDIGCPCTQLSLTVIDSHSAEDCRGHSGLARAGPVRALWAPYPGSSHLTPHWGTSSRGRIPLVHKHRTTPNDPS